MKGSTKYSLWLEPSGEIAFKLQERIKKLSKEHGTPLFSPHVTLLGGVNSSETELVPLANTLASSVEPFELKLTKAGYHNNFYQSLFIHVEQSNQLKELRNNACRLFDCGNREDFMPHLSLLYGELSQKQKERILNMVGREFFIRFPVKNIMVMQTEGTPDQWRKVHAAVFRQH